MVSASVSFSRFSLGDRIDLAAFGHVQQVRVDKSIHTLLFKKRHYAATSLNGAATLAFRRKTNKLLRFSTSSRATAISSASGCATKTSNCLARVVAVYSRFRLSIMKCSL